MKIAAVNKTNRSISFKYNPMQQRVAKYVKPTSSTAEKRTYYIRDAQGNVMAVYTAKVTNNSGTITWDTFYLSEQHLYGSNRLGLAQTNVKLYPGTYKNPHLADSSNYAIFEGWKRYELSNHLGNVLAVVSDRKIGKSTGTYPGPALWYEADVLSTQQYYPFGMLMPGRQYAVGSYDYRYGFNGKEGDDEVKGDDNQQDYGMRIYDPRVGRFLSVDPLAKQYPWYTPYQFAGNMPIWAVDLDGLEPEIANTGKMKTNLWEYMTNAVRSMTTGFSSVFSMEEISKPEKERINDVVEGNKFAKATLSATQNWAETQNSIHENLFPGYSTLRDVVTNQVGLSTATEAAFSLIPELKFGSKLLPLPKVGSVFRYGVDALTKEGLTAYETALKGGKHSGWMKKMSNLPTSKLQKSISSMESNIVEHKNLINDPVKYMQHYRKGEWDLLDPREQKALLNEKWPGDIRRAEEQINILQGIIKSR